MRILGPVRTAPATAWARLAIGLGQGMVLWLLSRAALAHAWPATEPMLLASLERLTWYLPVAAVMGLGNLRGRVFALWLLAAAMVLVASAVNVAANGQLIGLPAPPWIATGATAALVVALFIGQSLVTAADIDRKPIAAYATYFDVAWKYEVQGLLALLFLGLFWAVLWLGAELFAVIGLTFLRDLITKPWFAYPASTLAFAYAVEVTGSGAGLVRTMRNLLHALLSWLLPLATFIALGFVASLPFTGLTLLWRTNHGSELVLGDALMLVVLINTVYRDGDAAAWPAPLRWSGTAAALALTPLAAIAAYGLGMRVAQYGWTDQRVIGAAVLVIAACYALGYLWAALTRPWLKRLETANVAPAFVTVAVAVALLTPIADPARLSVLDQVARLKAGKTAPDKFDYTYLRFHGGRWGKAALNELAEGEGATKAGAARALMQSNQFAVLPPNIAEPGVIPVYPAGAVLPESFLHQNWSDYQPRYILPVCLVNGAVKCEAFVIPDAQGPAIILRELTLQRGIAFRMVEGRWMMIGQLSAEFRCANLLDALRAGKGEWVAARTEDLEAAGLRVTMTPPFPLGGPKCQ
jgi:hypothetical protein